VSGKTYWPESLAVGVVAVSTAIAIQGWPALRDADSQTWAAWVQGIGSVLAIGAAIWISREQIRQDRRKEQAHHAERIETILVLVHEALRLIREPLHLDEWDYFTGDTPIFDRRDFKQIAKALKDVPLHDLPPRIVRAILKAAQSAKQAVSAVEEAERLAYLPDNPHVDHEEQNIWEWIATLRDRLDEAATEIDTELQLRTSSRA
jgi:ABC-type nickel/cobalt efflux system permease component RcnA